MDAVDRAALSVVIAIACLLALAAAVWLPWWALPIAGAAIVMGLPSLAALMFRLRDRP